MINKRIELVLKKADENQLTEEDLYDSPSSYFLEIKTDNILELSTRDDILDVICSKVKKGGCVILSGIDLMELCRNSYHGYIDSEKVSRTISKMNRGYSVVTLKEFFQNKNWKINFIGIKNSKYLIEATR